METYTLGPGRSWLVRAFARNPLVRRSDRVEAILLLCALVAVLISASIAGAIGTGVYEGRSRMYAEQLRDRHLISATVVADGTTSVERVRLVETAPIRWSHNGVEHADTVEVDPDTVIDDSVEIWVDGNGDRVAAPRATWWAGVDAALVGGAAWLALTAAVGVIWELLCAVMARRRAKSWDRELRALVDDHGGRTGYQN